MSDNPSTPTPRATLADENDRNHYNRTVLGLMMSCPTIFPSEMACLNHLLLTIGTGFEWNDKGQRVMTLREPREKTDRSRSSVIGKDQDERFNKGGRVCFYDTLQIPFTKLSDWNSYCPLNEVLAGKVALAPDWKGAVEHLLHHIIQYSVPRYRKILEVYYLCHGYGPQQRKSWVNRGVEEFAETRAKSVRCFKKITGINLDAKVSPARRRQVRREMLNMVKRVIAKEPANV